jgi:diamine N-acetyltransferase
VSVHFREITRDNFNECVRLKVGEHQKFVAPNVYSIAQSRVEPENIPLAVYCDDSMVGFVMYSLEYEEKELHLGRIMIDLQHQHKGYGIASLELIRQIAMGEPGIERIGLSTRPDNLQAIRIYEKFGFKDTGIMEDGEEIFVLELEISAG